MNAPDVLPLNALDFKLGSAFQTGDGHEAERWSLDFVSDALIDSRRFRILAVIDDFSRECLALVADNSLSGIRVARP